MPTRRTSPRRGATRPSALAPAAERSSLLIDDEDPGRSWFSAAAPWLGLLALVLAAAALALTLAGRGSSGGDLGACRSAAWSAIPEAKDLPESWAIGSTDLNANGITISIAGPASGEDDATQPVIYASVTCYGDAAADALEANRTAATEAGATVTDRRSDGAAYEVDNPATGSVTTIFRSGGLVGQVADAGTAAPSDLAAVTTAIAAAMGDRSAAGSATAGAGEGSFDPDPTDLGSDEPLPSAFAPELEAVLPRAITVPAASASGSPDASAAVTEIALTVQSASATDVFGDDPSSRALAARIRTLGSTMDKLQIAQAYDETGSIDLSIVAFRLPDADQAKLRAAVIGTWLSADAEGVTTTTVELAGKSLTKVDYNDGSTIEYVFGKGDYVVVIDTAELAVATAVAAGLP